jgi:hypothetical protein
LRRLGASRRKGHPNSVLCYCDGTRRGVESVVITDRDRLIVGWIGRLGAVSAADVMGRFGMGRTATYRRLAVLVDQGLLGTERLLYGEPALYVATRDGLQWARLARLEPCRVSVASARHSALRARLAVVLERTEPAYRVWSEREVRVAELEAGGPVASAELGRLPDGRPRLRRADLVLVPRNEGGRRPVAVEVELAVKGARRLEAICRAWARCRLVDSVRYYASPAAARAVARAVERVQAHDVIEIYSLDETLKGDSHVGKLARAVA